MVYIDIVDKLPVKMSNGVRQLAGIKHAVIHHDAVFASENYDAVERYKSQAQYHIGKGWNRLSYHVKIDRMGRVYLCAPFNEITWHAGNYKVNLDAIGICLDGDFMKQKPSGVQVGALWDLLNNLTTERPDMPLLVKEKVKTHREVKIAFTSCPSETLIQLVHAYKI